MAESQPTADGISLTLPNEGATVALADALAAVLRPGDVIALTGSLGAGKTALARALINALPRPDGSHAPEEVPSPTFTLVQTYERAPAPVWHFDLYRLSDPGEVEELGWEEARAEGIALVEWPDRLGPLLPEERLDILLFFPEHGGGRIAVLQGGEGWTERLKGLEFDAIEQN